MIEDIRNRQHFYENIESLDSHISRFYEEKEITVFHEFLSLDFHLDALFINSKKHKFNIAITSGMSLLEMNVPESVENREEYAFAELMILLPKDIEFSQVHTGKEKNDWIISMLKETARIPHHNNTWLSIGHSVQATYDLEPYSDETKFAGCAVLPSVTFDEDFTEFHSNGRKINIYSLFPLYKNELEYKIENGFQRFMDILIKANAREIIDLNRKNLIP